MDFRFLRVASEGLGIIYVSAALCLILALLGPFFLFIVFVLLTVFLVFFSGIRRESFLHLTPVL